MSTTPQHSDAGRAYSLDFSFSIRLEGSPVNDQLRIVWPEDPPPVVSGTSPPQLKGSQGNSREVKGSQADDDRAGWTIEAYFDRVVEPDLRARGRAGSTITDYCTHVQAWRRYWGQVAAGPEYRIAYPVLRSITPSDLETWRAWLVDQAGKSAGVADKYTGSITAILRHAAARWVIERAAGLPRLTTPTVGSKFVFSLDQAEAMYAAMGLAVWPSRRRDGSKPRRPAADYWRAWLAIMWTYGPRVQEVWAYKSARSPLTWSAIDPRPTRAVEDAKFCSPAGWLVYTPRKQRRRKPRPLVLPLAPRVRELLDTIRPKGADDDEPIFDFPLSAGTSKGNGPPPASAGFYAQYWAIAEAAGIPTTRSAAGRRIAGPADFRNTALTAYGELGKFVTGHAAGRGVDDVNYRQPTEQLIEAIYARPQPGRAT